MAHVPTTSTTLLRDLGGDAQHVRWSEFVARYRPMMEAYLQEHFRGLESDDLIQETLVALVAALPNYRYDPRETGYFHNYLTGILRHKALRVCEHDRRYTKLLATYKKESTAALPQTGHVEGASGSRLVYEIALQQLLADDTIQDRTKRIFTRTAIDGEKPEAVAASLGLARNAVDQAKNRMMTKLRALVKALESVDGRA